MVHSFLFASCCWEKGEMLGPPKIAIGLLKVGVVLDCRAPISHSKTTKVAGNIIAKGYVCKLVELQHNIGSNHY
jgi:hypothetical protein